MKLIDASALLAFLLEESGADLVEAAFDDGAMSVINACEAATILRRKGAPMETAVTQLAAMDLTWVSPTMETSMAAARLCVHKGLSLGDRFCIAEAQARGAPILTADRVWAQLNLGVTVELIR